MRPLVLSYKIQSVLLDFRKKNTGKKRGNLGEMSGKCRGNLGEISGRDLSVKDVIEIQRNPQEYS